jgi:hypothetical protein
MVSTAAAKVVRRIFRFRQRSITYSTVTKSFEAAKPKGEGKRGRAETEP